MSVNTDCAKLCRGCLTSGLPLRPLEGELASLYNTLISTRLSKSNVLPKLICCYCLQMLIKIKNFRYKCQSVEASFLHLFKSGQLSLDGIKSSINYSYPLKTTRIQVISIHPNHEYQPTEYNPIDIENATKNNKVINLSPDANDLTINVVTDAETSVKSELYEYTPSICDGNAVFVSPSTPLEQVKSESDSDTEASCSLAELCYADVKVHLKKDDETIQDELNQELKVESSKKDSKMSNKVSPKKKLARKPNIPVKKRGRHEEVQSKSEESIGENKKSKLPSRTMKKRNRDLILSEDIESELEENHRKKLRPSDRLKKRSKRDELSEGRQTEFERNYDVKMIILTKEQQIKQLQERKESFNYKESKFKCELCYHGFDLEHTFNNHMGKHKLIEGNVLCDICSWSVPKNKLKSHIDRFHKYDYICNQCGYVAKFSITAKTHYRWHKGVRYNCKICGKSFDKPTSVMGHMHLSHKDVMTKCTICDQKCIGENGLSSHMKRSHKEAIGAVCATCDVQFHTYNALRRHRPHGDDCDNSHRACPVCGEGFATKQLLKEHKWEQHQKRDFVCETCMKHFVDYKKYLKHMRHHEIRKKRLGGARSVGSTFVCEICGSSYSNKHLFDLHRRKSHTGERPFLCDYCGKGFTSKGFLVVHIKSHMAKIENRPPKLYPCQYCYKQFTFPANVHRHEMTTHKGLRPFNCEICGGTFTTKKGMQNHVRHTHEGVPWPKRVRKTNHEVGQTLGVGQTMAVGQQHQVLQNRGW